MSTDRGQTLAAKAKLLITLTNQNQRNAVEEEIMNTVADLNCLPIVLDVLRNEVDIFTMFVITEALAKAYLRDSAVGVSGYSVNFKAVDAGTLTSTEFRAKKAVLDAGLQLLADRGASLPALVVDSLANLVGSGLALLWIELNHDEHYLQKIEDTFFHVGNCDMAVAGNQLLSGITLYTAILTSINAGGHKLGYQRYKALVTDIEEEYLIIIFKRLVNCIKEMSKLMLQTRGNIISNSASKTRSHIYFIIKLHASVDVISIPFDCDGVQF